MLVALVRVLFRVILVGEARELAQLLLLFIVFFAIAAATSEAFQDFSAASSRVLYLYGCFIHQRAVMVCGATEIFH